MRGEAGGEKSKSHKTRRLTKGPSLLTFAKKEGRSTASLGNNKKKISKKDRGRKGFLLFSLEKKGEPILLCRHPSRKKERGKSAGGRSQCREKKRVVRKGDEWGNERNRFKKMATESARLGGKYKKEQNTLEEKETLEKDAGGGGLSKLIEKKDGAQVICAGKNLHTRRVLMGGNQGTLKKIRKRESTKAFY